MEVARSKIVVELNTNDESKSLIFSEFSGNQRDPHHCYLQLRSGDFSFSGNFYFDNFSVFFAAVERMHEEMSGSAELREEYKDQFIKLEMIGNGHVLVSGVIEQTQSEPQKLQFGFKTDQTCLAPLHSKLDKVLNSSQ